jgi:YVTN family beta-propeller protein
VLEGARCIMQDNMRSHGLPAPRAVALLAALVLVFAFSARPAEAKPFAYVATPGNGLGCNGVLVIDTATNMVVATVKVGNGPRGIAVTPDGTHAYVANAGDNTVSVFATTSNTVVGSPIPVGVLPRMIAITPDGTHAYVVNDSSGTVSVIATATNTVEATVLVGNTPAGIAITPDGTRAYVVNCNCFSGIGAGTVSVIDTASNTVVGTPIPVGGEPEGVAVTPDGKHAYVTNAAFSIGSVSVIDTAVNSVGDTIPVGTAPFGVAVTPDGKHAYVANLEDNTVSVIATATNTVVGLPIPVGRFPIEAGIIPPPPGVPFLTFNALLAIQFGGTPNQDAFGFGSNITLSSTAPAINPVAQPVMLQVGSFATTIPIGSFVAQKDGSFVFKGSSTA